MKKQPSPSLGQYIPMFSWDNWLSYYIIHLDTSMLHQNGKWQTWCIVPKDSFKIVSQFGQFIGSRSPPWSHRSPDLHDFMSSSVPSRRRKCLSWRIPWVAWWPWPSPPRCRRVLSQPAIAIAILSQVKSFEASGPVTLIYLSTFNSCWEILQ